VLVLQFVLRLPDRQAAEAAQFDQRWRLALHLEAQDATFDPSLWDSYWDRYVESKVDPRAKAPALEEKAAQAGEDMLVIWKDAAGSRHIFERDSFVLLQRVFLENYTVDAAGRAHQTRTQPTGAVHSLKSGLPSAPGRKRR
jgi:hypothetical protein